MGGQIDGNIATATQGPQRASRLTIGNVALGAAFLISSIFSIGPRVFNVLGVTPSLRHLQPYQTHLANALVSYWIPCILIYAGFRLTRIDSKLRSNRLSTTAIGVGNVLLVSYVALRVFASTVSGGGGSFAVMSLAPLVVIPALILIAVGFIVLIKRSVENRSNDESLVSGRGKWTVELLVILIAVAFPILFALTLPIGKMYRSATGFGRLCESAEVKVLEVVEPAKSVALLPDQFAVLDRSLNWITDKNSMNGMRMSTEVAFLLNQSHLEYIEVPAPKQVDSGNQSDYVRWSTVGERILSGPGKRTEYVQEPIGELTAEYVVRPAILDLHELSEAGMGGSRIEIRRRSDNKLIAYAQYFWNKNEYRACPKEVISGTFVYDFVAGALGAKNRP